MPKKAAAPKTTKRAPRKKKAEAGSRGLAPTALTDGGPSPELTALNQAIEADGGQVLGSYRDPLGGHWLSLASLPLEKVEPTPFQRDLSETHVKRLTEVIDKLDRFLDPIIAVRAGEGRYWTSNGHHRLKALGALGAKAVIALLAPEKELAYKILALNTEKAHNLREKALEVVRMARDLAGLSKDPETTYALEFEEPSFLTLGLTYEARGRFSGGAYHPILKRVDHFRDEPLQVALQTRAEESARLLEVDDAVVEAVAALKAKGFESPYLKAFVVARINPIRFVKGELPPLDQVLEKMLASAKKFDAAKVNKDQVAAASGPPEES